MTIAVAFGGCAARLPPVPSKRGPAWFELTSEHFTLMRRRDVPTS